MVKGTIILTIAALLVLTATSVSFGKYSGGTGEPNDPYRIGTPNDLNDIGNHVEDFNKCFILVNDINMAGFTYTTAVIAPDTNPGFSFEGTEFTGTFDGNDHAILNLSVGSAGAYICHLGLFGQIEEPGQVKNLGIEDVNITGGDHGFWFGGLCGYNDHSTVSSCYATGSVRAGQYSGVLGGLCGYNEHGTIRNCYAAGSVSGGNLSLDVGGLCGDNYGTISNCYSTGEVGGGDSSDYLGGLVGRNFGDTISDCYATGSVTGDEGSDFVGGLCGYSKYGSISNCYATGSVDGDANVGGLIGFHESGSYRKCFWDSDVNPDVNGLGNTTDPNVVSKTTAEMMQECTFTNVGWDFVEVWDIGERQTYPFLRTHPTGDIDHDDKVDWFDVAILAEYWLEDVEP
ncbi:MAG: GLUG motif-containing protein [Planctomycetota bacterium]|jgi:hypothetical protein